MNIGNDSVICTISNTIFIKRNERVMKHKKRKTIFMQTNFMHDKANLPASTQYVSSTSFRFSRID